MEELQLYMCVGGRGLIKRQLFGIRSSLNWAKKCPQQRLEKCSIHGKITACSHLTLFKKLYSPLQASEKCLPPFSLSLEPRPACLPACLSVCVRWNLECTTFSKSDLLRTAPRLDWIPTQISVPKDTTVSQMESGQWLECPAVLAASQVWEWNEKKKGSKLIWHSLDKSM